MVRINWLGIDYIPGNSFGLQTILSFGSISFFMAIWDLVKMKPNIRERWTNLKGILAEIDIKCMALSLDKSRENKREWFGIVYLLGAIQGLTVVFWYEITQKISAHNPNSSQMIYTDIRWKSLKELGTFCMN
jgi:hypothetical protein